MASGRISIVASLKTEQARREAERFRTELGGIKSASADAGAAIDRLAGGMRRALAGAFSLTAVTGFGKAVFRVRSEIESLQKSFEVLVGKTKGAALTRDLRELAVRTPLMLGDFTKAAQTMLGFGIQVEEVLPLLKAIGDVAMGDSGKFKALTLAFSQMRAAGRLMGQDLLQMINAGFNPLSVIAQKSGKSIAMLKDEMSKGAVSAHDVTEAFLSATREGGKFNGMMESLSRTSKGALSNLKGAWEELLNTIGERTEGAVKGSIDLLTRLVRNYEKVGRIIASLIAAYGTYKAALITLTAIEKAHLAIKAGLTAAELAQYNALLLVEKAQRVLNKTLLLSPYGVLAASVAALTVGIYKSVTAGRELEKAHRELDAVTERYASSLAEENARIESLFARLRSAKKGTEEYKEAREAILGQYGGYLAGLGSEVSSLRNVEAAYQAVRKAAEEAARARAITEFTTAAAKERQDAIGSLRHRLHKQLREKLGAGGEAEEYFIRLVPVLEGREEVTEEIERLLASFDYTVSTSYGTANKGESYVYNALRVILDDAARARRVWDEVLKEAEVRFGKPSSGGLSPGEGTPPPPGAVVRETETEKDEDRLKRLRKQLETAEEIRRKKEELGWGEIQSQKKVTEEVLAAMEDGYAKSKALIENEFNDRKQELEHQYEEMLSLIRHNEEKAWLQGHGSLSGFEFNEEENEEAMSAQLVLLNELTALRLRHDNEIAALDREHFRTLETHHREYLKEYGTLEEKRLAVTKEYDEKIREARAEGDEWLARSLEKGRQEELYRLEKDYSALYALIFADAGTLGDALLARAVRETQEEIKKAAESGDAEKLAELYRRLRSQQEEARARTDWGLGGVVKAVRDLRDAQGRLSASTDGRGTVTDAETFKKALTEMEDAQKRIKKGVKEVTDSLGRLGKAMEGFGGTVGEIGQGLSAFSKEVSGVYEAIASKDKGAAISTAISGILDLVIMVGAQIQENARAQEEWTLKVMDAEHRYSMLRLRSLEYKESNIFGVESPYARAEAGAMEYAKAMDLLKEKEEGLAAARVQTGTKKVLSGKNIGMGLGAGAAAGAAIGSVIPGLGTAIGAAVGAAVGAITGAVARKTVPVFESLKKHYKWIYDEKTYELNPEIIADYEKLDEKTKKIVDSWDEIKEKALSAQEEMRENFRALTGDIGNQLCDSLVNAFRNPGVKGAMDDFHDYMKGRIEDIVANQLFAQLFKPLFDQLQTGMEKSFGPGGDEDIVDDLLAFMDAAEGKTEAFSEAMEELKARMAAKGIDLFTAEKKERSAATGGIGAAITQDSIDDWSARLTGIQAMIYHHGEDLGAVRAAQELIRSHTGLILDHVIGIDRNTSEAAARLTAIGGAVRAVQTAVTDMNERGVKIK